ncbi:YkvI family membrane protein [Zhaonella formicivorans]|uniref:YkvI family membrane protein n=1 Tax=Zhaonella formicivorans TaxID=2528593 RepID=UPI0010F06642|nr:hypothetical protein [Zhaonella formicivorans]
MKQAGRHSFAVASCYMGALIGAGFASGQEILQFFVQFGKRGLLGIALAGFCFAFLGGYTLNYKYYYGLKSYGEFLNHILGSRLGRLADLWITFILFTGLVIMLAGSTATLHQQFSIPFLPGLILTYALILWALSTGEKGVLIFNSLLIPVLTFITITVALLALGKGSPQTLIETTPKLAGGSWFFAAILYVSYNMILGTVILASLEITSETQIWGGILGGIGLGVLAEIMGAALYSNYREIAILNIPMLYLAKEMNWVLNYLYALAIWFAMLTTAVANIFSLSERLAKIINIPRFALVVVLLLLAALLTPFGFSRLIATLYPFFGYLGLVLLAGIILSLPRGLGFHLKKYFRK